MSKRFFMVGSHKLITKMFAEKGWTTAMNIPTADLVVFGGGKDVSPGMYGERPLGVTVSDPRLDKYESGIYNVTDKRKPKVGICRGAQLLNVMNKGSLWQHVDRHDGGFHDIEVLDPKTQDFVRKITVNSAHHQMMRPHPSAKLLAYAFETFHKESQYALSNGEEDFDVPEPEVVFYRETNSLCFQPHPEVDDRTRTREYFFELVEGLMEGNL